MSYASALGRNSKPPPPLPPLQPPVSFAPSNGIGHAPRISGPFLGSGTWSPHAPPPPPPPHAPPRGAGAPSSSSSSLKRAFESGSFSAIISWSNSHIPALLGGATATAGDTTFLAALEAHRYPLSLERTLKTLHLLTLYEVAPSEGTRAYVLDAAAKQLGELQDAERREIAAAVAARAAAGPAVFGAGLLTFAIQRHRAMAQRVFVRVLPLWRSLAARPDAAASAAADQRTLELMRAAATSGGSGGGGARGARSSSIVSDDGEQLMMPAGDDASTTARHDDAVQLRPDAGDIEEEEDDDDDGGRTGTASGLHTARSSALSLGGPGSAVGVASAGSDKSALRVTLSDASGQDEHLEKLGVIVRFGSERPTDVRVLDGHDGSPTSLAAIGDPRKPWPKPQPQQQQQQQRWPPHSSSSASMYSPSPYSPHPHNGWAAAPPRAPPPPPPPPRDLVSIDELPAHYARYSAPMPELLAGVARARPGTLLWTCIAEEWRRGGPKSSLDGHGDLIFLAVTPELLAGLRAAAELLAREGLPHPHPPAPAAASPVPDAAPAAVVPPLPLPLMAQPTPVMEPFKPLLTSPEHASLLAAVTGSRLLRGSLPLASCEAKFVDYASEGKNAAKRRQRHRIKLDEQAAEYGGVLRRECRNDALLGAMVDGCVASWSAVNASSRTDELILERVELASDAQLDLGRYKFCAAVAAAAAARASRPTSAASSTSGSPYLSAGGVGGGGWRGGASAPSPGSGAAAGSGSSSASPPGVALAASSAGSSGSGGGGGYSAAPSSLYDTRGGVGSGGGRTHPGSSGYVMTPTGPALLVDWKRVFPDGKMPRQRKRAKLMSQLERELARGSTEEPTVIMARLAAAPGDDT